MVTGEALVLLRGKASRIRAGDRRWDRGSEQVGHDEFSGLLCLHGDHSEPRMLLSRRTSTGAIGRWQKQGIFLSSSSASCIRSRGCMEFVATIG
jgi:hypothetical protein